MQDVMQHQYADLGEVRLHYVTAGQGPAVVLIHGWPQTWCMWRGIIPALAARYRVIVPDLRGLGDSSRPVGGYDKKTLAHDIWRLAHDVLGERRLYVVGHDWGGPVAYALAAQHRDAVRRMVIFDVPVPGDGSPVMFSNRWHHGLHWELDFPEALTAGREDIYLGFFYRKLERTSRRHRAGRATGVHPRLSPARRYAQYRLSPARGSRMRRILCQGLSTERTMHSPLQRRLGLTRR